MNAQEKVRTLEALLARVKKNAAEPRLRNVAMMDAAPVIAEATPKPPPVVAPIAAPPPAPPPPVAPPVQAVAKAADSAPVIEKAREQRPSEAPMPLSERFRQRLGTQGGIVGPKRTQSTATMAATKAAIANAAKAPPLQAPSRTAKPPEPPKPPPSAPENKFESTLAFDPTPAPPPPPKPIEAKQTTPKPPEVKPVAEAKPAARVEAKPVADAKVHTADTKPALGPPRPTEPARKPQRTLVGVGLADVKDLEALIAKTEAAKTAGEAAAPSTAKSVSDDITFDEPSIRPAEAAIASLPNVEGAPESEEEETKVMGRPKLPRITSDDDEDEDEPLTTIREEHRVEEKKPDLPIHPPRVELRDPISLAPPPPEKPIDTSQTLASEMRSPLADKPIAAPAAAATAAPKLADLSKTVVMEESKAPPMSAPVSSSAATTPADAAPPTDKMAGPPDAMQPPRPVKLADLSKTIAMNETPLNVPAPKPAAADAPKTMTVPQTDPMPPVVMAPAPSAPKPAEKPAATAAVAVTTLASAGAEKPAEAKATTVPDDAPIVPAAVISLGEKAALPVDPIGETAQAPVVDRSETTAPSRRFDVPKEAAAGFVSESSAAAPPPVAVVPAPAKTAMQPAATKPRRTSTVGLGLAAALIVGAGVFLALRQGWLDRFTGTSATTTTGTVSAPVVTTQASTAKIAPPPVTTPAPTNTTAATAPTNAPPVTTSAAPATAGPPSALPTPSVAVAPPTAAPSTPPSPSNATVVRDASNLAPNRALVTINFSQPGVVFVQGALAGNVGEPIEVDCGAKYFRIAAPGAVKGQVPTWLAEGRSYFLKCRTNTTIAFVPPLPGARPPTGDDSPY